MIVVDRRVAIIPGAEDLRVAIAVREPSVVAYLVDVFERAWERGRAFTNKDTSMLKDIAVEQRQMTIRMLVEGHADPVSAKRLGVSPRTYAGYVADLKDEYEAETRFQLGYTMGRLGISGTETDAGTRRARRSSAGQGAPRTPETHRRPHRDGMGPRDARTTPRGWTRCSGPGDAGSRSLAAEPPQPQLLSMAWAGAATPSRPDGDVRWRRRRAPALRTIFMGRTFLATRSGQVVARAPESAPGGLARHPDGRGPGSCNAETCSRVRPRPREPGDAGMARPPPARGPAGVVRWRRRRDLNPRWGCSPKPA